jgi:RNA polymerase sigma-70 factor (ECF subfamily)
MTNEPYARLPAGTRLEDEPDAQLVERARHRDEPAIRTIIQRHNQRLFRVARAVTRDDGEAEDVVQAAYVRAFTHLDGFRGESRLATWLVRITLNEALGRRRSRGSAARFEPLDLDGRQSAQVIPFPGLRAEADPETEMSRTEVRAMLERAIDLLPTAFRVVFVLRDIEGMSAEETAEHLSLRPATVNTRLHRARRLLRHTIEAELGAAFSSLFPFDGQRCAHMADRVIRELPNPLPVMILDSSAD